MCYQKIPVSVELFIRHLLYFCYTHIREIVSHLELSEDNKAIVSSNVFFFFPHYGQAWQFIKYIIQSRSYLFKNRNTCCIIICCLFGVIKLLKFDVTFVQLLKLFETLYPDLIQRAKYDILMKIDEIVTSFDQDRGNIIEFYNNIFVIANNEYLLQIKNNIL